MKKKLNSCVYDEYERLKCLFALETLDESKKTLIDELLQQMAFMKMELEIVQEQIASYGCITSFVKFLASKTKLSKVSVFNAKISTESPPVSVVTNIVELSFLFVTYKKLMVS